MNDRLRNISPEERLAMLQMQIKDRVNHPIFSSTTGGDQFGDTRQYGVAAFPITDHADKLVLHLGIRDKGQPYNRFLVQAFLNIGDGLNGWAPSPYNTTITFLHRLEDEQDVSILVEYKGHNKGIMRVRYHGPGGTDDIIENVDDLTFPVPQMTQKLAELHYIYPDQICLVDTLGELLNLSTRVGERAHCLKDWLRKPVVPAAFPLLHQVAA